MSNPLVFFFDVDNTLLDNDRVAINLRRHLEREVLGVWLVRMRE